MGKGLVDDEETDLEGKPGLTDCGLPLLNTVSLPGYWRACCQQTEQGEFRHSLLRAFLEAEIENGWNVSVVEDFLTDLND